MKYSIVPLLAALAIIVTAVVLLPSLAALAPLGFILAMPVVPSGQRASKYDAKLDSQVIADRIEARRPNMVARATIAANELVALDSAVRSIINNTAEPRNRLVYYMSFARELNKKSKSLAGTAFATEAAVLKTKWTTRGLTSAVCDDIIALFQM